MAYRGTPVCAYLASHSDKDISSNSGIPEFLYDVGAEEVVTHTHTHTHTHRDRETLGKRETNTWTHR
jgi:hypothetical protein